MSTTCGQNLAEKMREKFPDAKIIKGKTNKKIAKAVLTFIRKVQKAHEDAGKSKLRFGCA